MQTLKHTHFHIIINILSWCYTKKKKLKAMKKENNYTKKQKIKWKNDEEKEFFKAKQ